MVACALDGNVKEGRQYRRHRGKRCITKNLGKQSLARGHTALLMWAVSDRIVTIGNHMRRKLQSGEAGNGSTIIYRVARVSTMYKSICTVRLSLSGVHDRYMDHRGVQATRTALLLAGSPGLQYYVSHIAPADELTAEDLRLR